MMSQHKRLIVKISLSLGLSALQFLTAEFIVSDNERLFNMYCQAQLGEISQRHQRANPSFNTNMLGRTVSCRLTPL